MLDVKGPAVLLAYPVVLPVEAEAAEKAEATEATETTEHRGKSSLRLSNQTSRNGCLFSLQIQRSPAT
jgi:hypothetical protein